MVINSTLHVRMFPLNAETSATVVIVHFTVVCLVTLPLSGSEAGGDLALIQTFLPFIFLLCSSRAS